MNKLYDCLADSHTCVETYKRAEEPFKCSSLCSTVCQPTTLFVLFSNGNINIANIKG